MKKILISIAVGAFAIFALVTFALVTANNPISELFGVIAVMAALAALAISVVNAFSK